MNGLKQIIQGCLNPNTVQSSEKALQSYWQSPTFLTELLGLVPGEEQNKLIMILSTMKNYLLDRYNHPQNPIINEQKAILRENIFNFFYQINHCQGAINLYCQIVYIILAVDFQTYNSLFYDLLIKDMNSSISASCYFCRQLAKVYEWLDLQKRQPLQHFITNGFGQIEGLIQKIMTNYNEQTAKLLEQLLKMFYSCFHLSIPNYLRNFENFDKWLLYFKTIMKAPVENNPSNHRIVSRIYVKIITVYCNDSHDLKNMYKGWGQQFRERYGQNLYNQAVGYLVSPIADQQTTSNIVDCIFNISKSPDLQRLIEQPHCEAIVYQYLLPYMQSTSQQMSLFVHDSLEYLRRDQDLTCYSFRRMALDLIKSIMTNLNYGGKSQLIKFVEYSAKVLKNTNSTDKEKQVVLIVLTHLNRQIMKNEFLKGNFEQLTSEYFIPILSGNSQILISQTCKLLSEYLNLGKLSTPIVSQLMAILFDKMCNNYVVIKYHAVLAFTQLLYDKEALQSARPHFEDILKIYVKLLDTLDHEKLLSSLQEIVKIFSSQIVLVAMDLSTCLFNTFYSLHKKEQENDNDDDDEGSQAVSAISAIKQILQAPLSVETYVRISENILILLKNICDQYDCYFEQILTTYNVLVYKSGAICDYEFPYVLCRRLLEGNSFDLNACNLDQELMTKLFKIDKAADQQYGQILISILKNSIQKMPEQILHKYQYPIHPELILCLIENKKIHPNDLQKLGFNKIDQQWSQILQGYTAFMYGIGAVNDCQQMQVSLLGISLFPWIQNNLNINVVKRVLYASISADEEDDDFDDEQNTNQMLEKYANEDDEDELDEYYVSEGGNYTYLYDSPFDSRKDVLLLVQRLKQLPGNSINNILSELKYTYRSKLQALLSAS